MSQWDRPLRLTVYPFGVEPASGFDAEKLRDSVIKEIFYCWESRRGAKLKAVKVRTRGSREISRSCGRHEGCLEHTLSTGDKDVLLFYHCNVYGFWQEMKKHHKGSGESWGQVGIQRQCA